MNKIFESLEIQNFQSWGKVKLNFHKGVNIIVGQSNKGKSSIFRALYWICNNRPTGNSFKSNFTKKNTKVTLKVDGHNIIREKSNKLNIYNIDNSPEDLQALRSDVPDEIKNIILSNEETFGHQQNSFFLLDETPGKVAKKFNKIAGLEIMDKSLTSINSILRESKQDLKSSDKNIEKLEKEIKDLDWIESCNKRYAEIEKQTAVLKSHKEDLNIIENLIIKYDTVLFELHKLSDVKALPKIESIFKKDDELYTLEQEIENINRKLLEYAIIEKKIKRISALNKAKLTTVNDYKGAMDKANKEVDKINDLFSAFEEISTNVDQAESLMNLAEEDLFKFKQENSMCPICNKKW